MPKIANAEGNYVNPNYRVTLKDRYSSNQVSAFLPESFAFTLDSQWETMINEFAQGIVNGGTSLIGTVAGGAIGNLVNSGIEMTQKAFMIMGQKSVWSKFSTLPTWTGNSPLEFTIPFRFDAISDASRDVKQQVLLLAKMASPSLENGTIYAPGPAIDNLSGDLQKKNRYDLRVGNFMYIKDVYITNVSTTVYSRFDKSGTPICADCSVSLKTYFAPTQDDIIGYFNLSGGGMFGSDNFNINTVMTALKDDWVNKGGQLKDQVAGLMK